MTSSTGHRRKFLAGAAITVAAAGMMVVPAIASAAPLDPTPAGGNTTTPPAPPSAKTPPAPEVPQTPGVQACNETTKSGGQGITETLHLLGTTGPASFVLEYETLKQPDEIAIFYQGLEIANTGYVGDNTNEGTGSIRAFVPPGLFDSVQVRVTGPEEGTEWSYTVKCPDFVLPLR